MIEIEHLTKRYGDKTGSAGPVVHRVAWPEVPRPAPDPAPAGDAPARCRSGSRAIASSIPGFCLAESMAFHTGGSDEMPAALLPSPLQTVDDDRAKARGVEVLLKRDDLIHSAIPGNKWRKLVPNLEAARVEGARRLLTFGGAWSNHIAATAAAGPLWGFDTIGVIRGEEHLPLNPVLAGAARQGMQLVYMDRGTYRRKAEPEVIDTLRREHGDPYLIPEGGSNALAVRSCRAISEEIGPNVDVVCCAVGTGGTLAGIAAGLAPHQEAVGFSALKGGDFLTSEVDRLQHTAFGGTVGRWRIETGYHLGGFARRTRKLDTFIEDFDDRHGVRLEWVYVAKMMAGLFDLIEQGQFPTRTRIAAVLTGPPGP